MKIKKYTKLKSNKYKITLENDEVITLYDDVILDNNLLLTKEIKNINKLLKENSYFDAYYSSLKYLEKKLRTKKELKDYLKLKYDNDIVEETIKKIEKTPYLNDDIYAKSYIHDQILLTNNGYYKILNSLKNKDINEDIIKKYLDEIDNNVWLEKLNKLVDKKIKNNTKYSSNYLKEKLLNDLYNLGYNKSDILNVINKKDITQNSDILDKTYNNLYNKLSKKYSGKELKLQLLNKLMMKGFKYSDIKVKIDKI